MNKVATVEQYLLKHQNRISELELLRDCLLESGLQESIKWGAPVYTLNGKNVIGIGAFKSYVGLWFYQGVFLKDPKGILINAQENKTKAMRQMRFDSYENMDIKIIKEYISEAIENQRLGKMAQPEKRAVPPIPELIQKAFKNDLSLKNAFLLLSDSCKREYIEYIDEAKKEETKLRRLTKIIPLILNKKGLNDQYK